jgi:hypothetical protein
MSKFHISRCCEPSTQGKIHSWAKKVISLNLGELEINEGDHIVTSTKSSRYG